jgi:ABC-type nitrate/sulfonate/bicarbonate transport system substrate-binding protein
MKLPVATPSRTLFALPYWIAENQGYFADEGLEPSLALDKTGDQIKTGLRSGEVAMSIDPPDGVLLDAFRGGSLRILAGNAGKPPLFIIAQPEIRSLADLRGKTFGVLSLQEGSSKFIPKIGAAGGLSPGEYRIVEVGGAPMRSRLLVERKIDVGLQPMPLNYEAEAGGFSNLGWTGIFEPEYQFTTVNADLGWVQRESHCTVAALRALLRGLQFASANPLQAAEIVAPELRTDTHYAHRAIVEAIKLGILDPELGISRTGLEKIRENLQATGALSGCGGFEVSDAVALEFLTQARTEN